MTVNPTEPFHHSDPAPPLAVPETPDGPNRSTDACRAAAYRRRHRPPDTPEVLPPPGQPRTPITVYECANCDTRTVGEQRCEDCGTFMHRVGIGGLCPCCDEPVTIDELLNP